MGAGGGHAGGGQRRQLLTSKVLLQWGKEVANDGYAPGLPQQLLPLLPVHVPHIGVVFGETKDSGGERDNYPQVSIVFIL